MVQSGPGGVASRGGANVPDVGPEMTPERTPEDAGASQTSNFRNLETYNTWNNWQGMDSGSGPFPQTAEEEATPNPSGLRKIRITKQGEPSSQGNENMPVEDDPDNPRASQRIRNSVIYKLMGMEKNMTAEKKSWIETTQADVIFGSAILLNAIFLGISVDNAKAGVQTGINWTNWIVESVFLVVFVLEICLRVQAVMPQWTKFFDYWGMFDLFVTVLSLVDNFILTFALSGSEDDSALGAFTVLRIFRLFRLIRIVRVLKMFKDLIVMVQGLSGSFKSVGWMSLLMLIIMYTGSILVVVLIGQPMAGENEDIDHFFGSLIKAMYSHFCLVTLEGWISVSDAAILHASWIWGLYSVGLICFTNMVLLNLMVGCIVERIIVLAEEQEQEVSEFAAESQQLETTLGKLFSSSDLDASGDITYQEVRAMLDRESTAQILDTFGINISIPHDVLHTIMHLDRDGVTTFKAFFDAVIRLCGSKSNIHSMFVQYDVCRWEFDLVRKIKELEAKVAATISRRNAPPPGRRRASRDQSAETNQQAEIESPKKKPSKPAPQNVGSDLLPGNNLGVQQATNPRKPIMDEDAAATKIQSAFRAQENSRHKSGSTNKKPAAEPPSTMVLVEGGMTLAEEAAQLEELRRRMARCEAAQAQALDDVQELRENVAARGKVLETVYNAATSQTGLSQNVAVPATLIGGPAVSLPAAADTASNQKKGPQGRKILELDACCTTAPQ